jgi:hypothetical protein
VIIKRGRRGRDCMGAGFTLPVFKNKMFLNLDPINLSLIPYLVFNELLNKILHTIPSFYFS